MENSKELLHLSEHYLIKYPNERNALRHFVQFVVVTNGEQLYHRKNFAGHITAGAFVVDRKSDKVLLLGHKFLKKWLQPGGHVDRTDESILAAAIRECVEETALSTHHLEVVSDNYFSDSTTVLPFDIDSHPIPTNEKKLEDAHFHFDIRYLFILRGQEATAITIDQDESTDARWFSIPVLASREGIFQQAAIKILALLQQG